jgi:hypothetical protein
MTPAHEAAPLIARAREEPLQTRTRLAQTAFLAEFRQTCNIRLACEQSGVGRRTVYDWRERDQQFQEQYRDAEQDAVDRLEAAVWTRSVEGVERPVFQKGGLVGHTREYSDHLTIALLKAHRPEKFREDEPGGPSVIVHIGCSLSDVQVQIGEVNPPAAPELPPFDGESS